MLTDDTLAQVVTSRPYKRITKLGVKHVLSDISKGNFKEIDPRQVLSSVQAVFKNRAARSELLAASRSFIERLLNSDLVWERTPSSIQAICGQSLSWMRFDVPQIQALKLCFLDLITRAELRSLLKSYSGLPETEANSRLEAIRKDGVELLDTCIKYIRWSKAQVALERLLKDETAEEMFFMEQKGLIDARIKTRAVEGRLGTLPSAKGVCNE